MYVWISGNGRNSEVWKLREWKIYKRAYEQTRISSLILLILKDLLYRYSVQEAVVIPIRMEET